MMGRMQALEESNQRHLIRTAECEAKLSMWAETISRIETNLNKHFTDIDGQSLRINTEHNIVTDLRKMMLNRMTRIESGVTKASSPMRLGNTMDSVQETIDNTEIQQLKNKVDELQNILLS
jgi:archaellum component FlaC